MKWFIEIIHRAPDTGEAARVQLALREQEGCLGTRRIKDGLMVQAFFEDAPEARMLPDGVNRRLVPAAVLGECRGIAA